MAMIHYRNKTDSVSNRKTTNRGNAKRTVLWDNWSAVGKYPTIEKLNAAYKITITRCISIRKT